MTELLMQDVSEAGHELGRAVLHELPSTATLRELLRWRIQADVDRYNEAPGLVYQGLVQPADAMRYSDGFRMASPRQLDADLFLAAAEEAVAAGILRFAIDGATTDDLERRVEVDEVERLTAVLRRPVVARDR